MKQTTFALIGTGIVGERIIQQLLANHKCTIISIFDENNERLQEIANKYQLPIASSLEELFNTKPHWVYIGTPPNSHASLALEASKKGCYVLSEKPLAHNVESGKLMVESTKQANILTAMHFPLMYSPAIQTLMSEVANHTLGDILRVELHTYFPHWPRKWQQNPWIGSRAQGGFIREVFPHYFQIMYRLFGNFSFSAHQTIYPENQQLSEIGSSAIGQTDTGIPIVINGLSGMGQQEILLFKVFGTKKVMTIKNWSELWVSECDQPDIRVELNEHPKTLWDACHDAKNGREATLVSFEEGLIVQRWIDELLT
ncbi:Gfo/Idh/MocA family protein [Paenisporosarcina sp. OV554]|uniref:Gfo/Idh/MocA family protein n=1 Tax=Paenisporosarcina sp. OV554 TaxID=2135694 RepID=UPI000D3B2BBD|nr:Gfo/Idh/MocA family oxidoreductase [Paenisporosarcina sp. OV554]PUB17964.1 putative dehydrogenase [Paenisporosarcina sp. OV554]